MAEVPPELAAEVQKLERYHTENPQGRYFVPLANAYRKAGELEQAEALLREGLRRHPDYLSAHIVLGRCLADRGATEEAAAEFRHVLSVDPQNLIALRSLGEMATERGQGQEAVRWYRELLAVDPMNEEARQALETLEGPPSAPAEEPRSEEGLLGDGLGWGTWGEVELDEEPAPAVPEPDAASGGWDPFVEGTVDLDVGGEPEPATGEPEEEVVTETIAELYARQGFYDRAADVYRELLRRRGEDARLREKLAEVEALAMGRPPLAAEEPAQEAEDAGEDLLLIEGGEPLPMLDVDSGGGFAPGGETELTTDLALTGTGEDAFADSFAAGFGGDEAPAAHTGGDLAEAPPAGESSPAAAPAGEAAHAAGTVRDYFTGLLAWTPAREAAAEAPAASAPVPALESEAEPQAEPEPDAGEDLPWLTPPPVEPETPPTSAPADDGGETFPWELPVEPAAEAQPGGAGAPDESSFSFEEFFTPPPAASAPAPESRAETPSPPAPAPPAQPEQPEQSEQPAGESAAESAGGEGDEDLESFQAWLQSLKR